MDLQEAVDSIWESAQQGIYYPAEWRGKFNVEEAYQVQLGILERYLAKGETQAGWKVGLTAKAIQHQLDVHEPVFGFLLESGRKPSGFLLDFEELVAPCMEVELCLTLGKPLKGPGISPADAREALSAVEPALEIVERRGDFAADLPLALADNAQQKFFVLGTATSPLPPDLKLAQATVEVSINGERMDQAQGSNVMGDPAASVAWLANKLATRGKKLEAGMRVMSGSFTKQFPIAQGDLFEARFQPFGMVTLQVK